MVGRPTVMTPEVVAKLEQAFAIDATVEEACSYADISRDAFYDYLKKNPDFSDRIGDLRQKPILKARQTIVKSLDNPTSAQWYLSRKRKNEFAERVEQTGKDGGPIEYEDSEVVRRLTEQLNAIHRGTSVPSDGTPTSAVDTEAQN